MPWHQGIAFRTSSTQVIPSLLNSIEMAEFGSLSLVLLPSPAVVLRVGVFGDRDDSLVVRLDEAAVRGL